jgi:phosphopantothenoylcysteine decarboxylase/phosphopantothenate--cysteine ligase
MTSKRPRRLHVLVTAGPTVEHLDTVRYLSNASTGKMGYAIAESAIKAGHRVTLVSGPVELKPPPTARLVRVVSALEMLHEARRAFVKADAAVFSAAVCDYRPRRRWKHKRPKSKSGIKIELVSNPDIAATLGRQKGERVTIGFALEDHSGRSHARKKLENKRLDAIILNSPANIGSDVADCECYVPEDGWAIWRTGTKRQVAAKIVTLLEALSNRTGE